MSCRSRGVCVSAILLIAGIAPMVWASSSTADSSSALPLVAPNPSSPILPFDANSLINPKSIETDFTLDPGGATDFSAIDFAPWPTNSVTHVSPINTPAESDKPAAQHEDLVVPFPALGAGWILLMGGALCKIGSRVVRPN
jgi:hypothetical protein